MAIDRRTQRTGPSTPQRIIHGVPYELQVVQRATERATRKSRSDQHAKHKRIKVVSTAPGEVTVSHGLGFKPNSFVPVRMRGAVAHTVVSANSRTATFSMGGAGTLEFEVY